MRGMDYRWIEALDAVVNYRSFEKAAQILCISQSAVSQRIKQLEKWSSQPVLVREQPPRATLVGQKLLGLYRRVSLLEQDLLPELTSRNDLPIDVSIATNADSLATWVLPSLAPLLVESKLALNFVVDDESRTLEKLRTGEVVGAICIEDTSIPGCTADYLGVSEYICVASPDFCQRYFPNGVTREALLEAPAVVFNQYDHMHEQFIKKHFSLSISNVVKHTVRSSEAFVSLTSLGVAYSLIPKLQICQELEQGCLINIVPEHSISNELYWHHWQLESGVLKQLSNAIIQYAKETLPQQK
ncbi:LysR family transcriptional regulator ArgP [Vibrio algarum]|uniref:HTH-type transcriptional regulator ArgP n=1 Tax=Vibrio algarum TaxID=3020714 RepID=A0ABT4YTN3_9VIBR|nr:LysR family transcriptional regulator ArgP [Vibrio sp. KJ40-1]MDB1124893.1 LysR family transcriptional regulator ArgP [Vibrio sp. KJ40-1]